MRTPRLYTPQALASGELLVLDEAPAHHLAVVLRARLGQEVVLFNGEGLDHAAEVVAIDRRRVSVAVGAATPVTTESPLSTTLAIGVSRGERFDWVLQKATELGVSAIQPLWTERCGVRLDEKRQQKKQQHWQQVVISACEQSGRAIIPQLLEPEALPEWLPRCSSPLRLILHPEVVAAPAFVDQTPCEALALLVGPEGGFSESEVAAALAAGFQALRLGPRILRTETAPLAALAMLQARWGDLA